MRCSPLLLALLCGPLYLSAETAADAPLAPTVENAAPTVEQLRKNLPQVPSISAAEGRLWWSDDAGNRVPFAAVDVGQGNPLLDSEIGNLAIDRRLIADERTEVILRLRQLVATAKAAGLSAKGFTVREGILTGIHLRSDNSLVLPEGVLTKADLPAGPDRAAERTAITTATTKVLGLLPGTALDDLGRQTVDDVLGRLARDDGDEGLDEVSPATARRVVRGGWLNQFLRDEQTKPLVEAVLASERFHPTMVFRGHASNGSELRLAEMKDGFGHGGWVLTTPTRSAYARNHPSPLYHSNTLFAGVNLVVELPPGSDPTAYPTAGASAPLSAKLFRNGQCILEWNPVRGIDAERTRWRSVIPDVGTIQKADAHNASGSLPPHAVVVGLNGDVAGLISAGGWLAAPTTDPKDVDRFLGEAARQLPTAADLDLVGEYFLTYVYDSPDSRFPQLIGNKKIKGDIHQTAAQTMATATGGMMRGDCDDLAELYQVIAERQGRTSIVLALPSHAAAAWAEKQTDGQWHVFVLQTGPALEFADASLPNALAAAYKAFGASETFDPNGLGLLLRFSGENTRSSWRLSWRIFAEPDYAKTMIEVQKDWHFQTYQRGIASVLGLIAKGDKDTANYRELAGLTSFTSQYDEAVRWQRQAIEAMDPVRDAEGRLLMQIELVEHLFNANRGDEAKAVATDIIERSLPPLRERMGIGAWNAGMQLTGMLTGNHAPDLARRAFALVNEAIPGGKGGSLPEQLSQVAAFVQSPRFNLQAWENNPQLRDLRALVSEYAGVCLGMIGDAGTGRLAADPALRQAAQAAETWLTHIGFVDVDEPGEAPMRYAFAGRYYAAVLGQQRFDQMLADAAMPTDGKLDHTKRVGGLAQLPADLPWIRMSVPYWLGRLGSLVSRDNETVDRAEVARLAKALDEAYTTGTALGVEHPRIEFDRHLGRLIAALLLQDEAEVRARLRYVVEKNDKRLRDDTAQWIGDAARFMPIEWFNTVMGVWNSEVHYKDKYYWIAWRAIRGKATQHALLAAKIARDRFPDDAAFAEEYEFMRKLYEPAAK